MKRRDLARSVRDVDKSRGRYRVRTWLRGRLPYLLSDRIGKGAQDCGAHEWHLAKGGIYHCYHCKVGVHQGRPAEWG